MNSSQKVLNFGKVVIVLWLHKMIVKCLCFSCCLTCIVLGISMSSGIWNEKGNAYGFDSSIKNRLPVDNRRYLVIWKRVIRSVSCTWNAISPVNWISILCVSIRWWGWIMTWPKKLYLKCYCWITNAARCDTNLLINHQGNTAFAYQTQCQCTSWASLALLNGVGKRKKREAEKVISCTRDILVEKWLCTQWPVPLKGSYKKHQWMFEIAVDDAMYHLYSCEYSFF